MKRALLLLVLLLLPLSALGDLVYKGEQTLWQDTVWEGEVLVDGIVTVAPEVTLEVRPGTIVRFTRKDSNRDTIGDHELFIQGRFRALGTASQPVVFTSAEKTPVPGDWGAVNMMASTEENLIQHALFEYGYRGFHAHFAKARLIHSQFRYNRRGAQFQESTISIDDCSFVDNFNGLQFRDSTVEINRTVVRGGYWGMRCVYSNLKMSHSLIENNLVNGINLRDSEVLFSHNTVRDNRRGVYLQRTAGQVVENLIEGNREHGVYLEDSSGAVRRNRILANGRAGLRIVNSGMEIVENDILFNAQYGLINDGDQSVLIGANWWGTESDEDLARLVRDGLDRDGSGNVTISGLLIESALK